MAKNKSKDKIENGHSGISDPVKATHKTIPELKNSILVGDVLLKLAEIPDASIDLVVTSPPYNLLNSSGNGMKDGRGGKWPSASLLQGYEGHADCLPHEVYAHWQRSVLTECMRVLKGDGAIFYNHKWRVQNGLLQDRSDIVSGFPVRQIIIWKRAGGINFNKGYFLPTYEVVYLIAKKDFILKAKANAIGDVWEIKQEHDNPHPAPFPEQLATRIIQSTNAKIVLDPFMGSGTTAVAALNLGLNYIGIELSEEYAKMANERISKLRNPAPVFRGSVMPKKSVLETCQTEKKIAKLKGEAPSKFPEDEAAKV